MVRLSSNISVPIGLHAAVLLVAALVSDLLGQDRQGAVPGTKTATEGSSCRLTIEGRGIERLTLVEANDDDDLRNEKVTKIERPGAIVSLPAGKYRVQEVELKGGFSCHEYFASDDDWIHVAVGQSPVVKAGAPLTPKVSVKRTGRVLAIDYELVDAAGRTYTPGTADRRAKPPTFTVLKNGQTIGSGTFEYG